jgi:L-rhamnose mutarotase
MKMNQVIVRYTLKPDRVAENVELVRAVYDELERTKPAGLRYATFQLDDGVSFVHVAVNETDSARSPLTELAAFQEFQREIADRCEEQPQASAVRQVGAYRFFDRG